MEFFWNKLFPADSFDLINIFQQKKSVSLAKFQAVLTKILEPGIESWENNVPPLYNDILPLLASGLEMGRV